MNNQEKLSLYIKNIKATNLPTTTKLQLINKKINTYIAIQNYINVNKNKNNTVTIKPRFNALLVGINYIGTPNELDGCINDVNNMKKLLIESFGFTEENIIMLTDNTAILPTKENIINELTKLIKNAVSGDRIFFGYSGHGTTSPNTNGTELSGRDQILIPIDAKSISQCIMDDELNSICRNNISAGVNMFGLIDACYTGTIFDLKYNYMTDAVTTNNTFSITVNPSINVIGKGQIMILSGSKDDQKSADASVKDGSVTIYTGAMTYSFLRTISSLSVNVTLQNIMSNMRIILTQNKFTQVPQLSSDSLIDISSISLKQFLSN